MRIDILLKTTWILTHQDFYGQRVLDALENVVRQISYQLNQLQAIYTTAFCSRGKMISAKMRDTYNELC